MFIHEIHGAYYWSCDQCRKAKLPAGSTAQTVDAAIAAYNYHCSNHGKA